MILGKCHIWHIRTDEYIQVRLWLKILAQQNVQYAVSDLTDRGVLVVGRQDQAKAFVRKQREV